MISCELFVNQTLCEVSNCLLSVGFAPGGAAAYKGELRSRVLGINTVPAGSRRELRCVYRGLVPSAYSFAMVVGNWEEPTGFHGRGEFFRIGIHCGLRRSDASKRQSNRPEGGSRTLPGRSVVTVCCIYHHLPLIYQFSVLVFRVLQCTHKGVCFLRTTGV